MSTFKLSERRRNRSFLPPGFFQKRFWIFMIMAVATQTAVAQIKEFDMYVPRDYYGWLFPVAVADDKAFIGRDESAVYIYQQDGEAWNLVDTVNVNSFIFQASSSLLVVSRSSYISIYQEVATGWEETKRISSVPGVKQIRSYSLDDNRLAVRKTYLTNYEEDSTTLTIYDFVGNNIDSASVKFEDASLLAVSGNLIVSLDKQNNQLLKFYQFNGTDLVPDGTLLLEKGGTIDVDGNRLIHNTRNAVCYVYENNGSGWSKTAELRPKNGIPNHEYSIGGNKAILSGDLVALTIYKSLVDDVPQLVVVFEYNGNEWHEKFNLNILNGDSELEPFIGLSGKNLLVSDLISPIMYDLDHFSNSEPFKLTASDGLAHAVFGTSTDISPTAAIVGAPGDHENTGAAYLFDKVNSEWQELLNLTADDGEADDQYGFSVGILARKEYMMGTDAYINTAVVGAPFHNGKGAIYVYARKSNKPWQLTAKLTAPDGMANDQFGYAVAIGLSGTIVVGAPYHDSNGKSNSGAVYTYFYDRIADQWKFATKITAPTPKKDDLFGWSLDYDERIIIGAPRDDEKAHDAGAVYIISRSDMQLYKIMAQDAAANDRFGISVGSYGRNVIVGAHMDDDDGKESGAAYIFEAEGSDDWIEKIKLTASDAAAQDRFGISVSMDENIAVVGASYADHTGGTNAGAAYVFTQVDSVWSEREKLTGGARTGDRLGNAVSVAGPYVMAGAYHDDDKILGKDAGSAYIFGVYNTTETITANASSIARIENDDEFYKPSAKEIQETVKNPLVGVREMKIYPNSFEQKFAVELEMDEATSVEVTLLDQLGRTLYQHQFSADESQQQMNVDLTHTEKPITSGIVYLGLKTPQGSSKWVRLIKR